MSSSDWKQPPSPASTVGDWQCIADVSPTSWRMRNPTSTQPGLPRIWVFSMAVAAVVLCSCIWSMLQIPDVETPQEPELFASLGAAPNPFASTSVESVDFTMPLHYEAETAPNIAKPNFAYFDQPRASEAMPSSSTLTTTMIVEIRDQNIPTTQPSSSERDTLTQDEADSFLLIKILKWFLP